MFKSPLPPTQLDKLSLEAIEGIEQESTFLGETLHLPRGQLRSILQSTDTVEQLRTKYLDYRLGGQTTKQQLNDLVAQMKSDIGDKQGGEVARLIVRTVDAELATVLEEGRGV